MTWGNVAGAVIGVVGGAIASHNSGGSRPSVSNQSSLTDEQNAALVRVINTLLGRGSATTPYGGNLNFGETGGQATSLAAMEQAALDAAKNNTTAQDEFRRAMSDTGTDTSALFEKSVADPAIKQFQERILPSITQRFAGNAAFGSDRRATETKAASDLSGNLASAREQMVFQSTEAAKNRALQAASGSTQASDTLSQIMARLFSGETVLQGQQQGDLDRQYQEFLRQQGGTEQNIQDILRAIGLPSTNTIVNPGQPGFLTAAAPGIGNAMTMYMLQQMMRSGGSTGSPGFVPDGSTPPM